MASAMGYVLAYLAFLIAIKSSFCYMYQPRECPPIDCGNPPGPPENCRSDFVYGYVNGQRCAVSCKVTCKCPKPSPQSLEFCKNTDPLCFVQKDIITLPDGQRCFNGCLLACQGMP